MGLMQWGSNLKDAGSQNRWRAAFAVALVSDAVSFGLEVFSLGLAEFPQLLVDLFTALVLALLLGLRKGFLVPLILEALPATAAFPSWALAVAAYAALGPGAKPAKPAKTEGQDK